MIRLKTVFYFLHWLKVSSVHLSWLTLGVVRNVLCDVFWSLEFGILAVAILVFVRARSDYIWA